MGEKYLENLDLSSLSNGPRIDAVGKGLQDQNDNSIPDFMEKIIDNLAGTNPLIKSLIRSNIEKFIVQGKTYDNFDQIPEKYKQIINGQFKKTETHLEDLSDKENSDTGNIINTVADFSQPVNLDSRSKPIFNTNLWRNILFILALLGIGYFIYQKFFLK